MFASAYPSFYINDGYARFSVDSRHTTVSVSLTAPASALAHPSLTRRKARIRAPHCQYSRRSPTEMLARTVPHPHHAPPTLPPSPAVPSAPAAPTALVRLSAKVLKLLTFSFFAKHFKLCRQLTELK